MNWFKAGFHWIWDTFKVAWPLWGAAIVTAGFGRWVYLLAIEVTVQEPYRATRWQHFLHGRPNELGDALAGFVGSLTLIWVVASVIQQSMELKAQRKEFEQMSLAMQSQVTAMQEQTLLLAEDRKRREQELAGQVLNELLSKLAYEMHTEARTASLLGPELYGVARYRVFAEKTETESSFDFVLRNRKSITNFWALHDGEFSEDVNFFRGNISLYGAIATTIEKILELRPRLSEEIVVRLDRLELDQLKFDLELFLKAENWHNDAYNEGNFHP